MPPRPDYFRLGYMPEEYTPALPDDELEAPLGDDEHDDIAEPDGDDDADSVRD